jgi:hypothetical protein
MKKDTQQSPEPKNPSYAADAQELLVKITRRHPETRGWTLPQKDTGETLELTLAPVKPKVSSARIPK